MNWNRTNRITAAIVFVIAFIVYLSTAAPTVSFWDCGEFIACSFRMAVPHPPGAPLFLLVGRLFSLLPIAGNIALRVNIISVVASALTIMLLYLIIVHLLRQAMGKLETTSDWLTAIFSGVIGALAFAFTHSFWFNAVEAEVYASSMLFTSLMVWLIMVWATKSDQDGNERYLLMMAYLVGLAIAVHLLNVLAIPFVAMVFYYKRFEFNAKSFSIMVVLTGLIMLAVYPGMVKMIPKLALNFGAAGLIVFFLAVLWGTWWAISHNRTVYALVFASILLITIGYSSYGSIFVRSNLNPQIDENNPETVENFVKYIEREQYGDHSITDREGVWRTSPNAKHYHSASEYFWKYQINKMYIRYFLWNFVGLGDDETNTDASKLWGLPLLLGIFGIFWHFRKDPKHALAVLGLFFMTGLAIVLYLNQPDPQPRERDYSYVGSFFAFSIWVGIGFAGIMEFIKDLFFKDKKELKPILYYATFIVLLLVVPGRMLAVNYHQHDRSGNYVAWDYSYNMLMSCEPDAILFTNGDNDTFPLWYLQEVEGVRTDVRIVNLSLLNTDWYIRQLRDLKPRVPMRMSDGEIDRVGVRPWKEQMVTIKVPKSYAEKEHDAYEKQFDVKHLNVPDKIEFKVKPAVNTRYGGLLRTQDYMIINIIAANRWRRPIYFAVTVPNSNMVSELARFMRMDGLVMKLVPYKNWDISPENLYNNLMNVYHYRGLNDPSVYFNRNIISLLQNYRHGFLQLADYYTRTHQYEKVKEITMAMNKRIDPEVIPWTNKRIEIITKAFRLVADSSFIDTVLSNQDINPYLPALGEHLLRLQHPIPAVAVLNKAYQLKPGDPRTLGLLLNAYQMSGQEEKAIEPLGKWVQSHPEDKNAKSVLNSIKARVAKQK